MSFRVNARHFSITYPQCPLEKQTALDLLLLKYPTSSIEYLLAQEKHQDGSLHLHLYLKFERKKNIKDPRAFDLSKDGTTYHPNVQACREPANWIKYLQKEDESPLTNISKEDLAGDIWAAVVAEKDPDVAEDLIARKDPKRLVNNWNNISNYLSAKRQKLNEPPPWKPTYPLESFVIPHHVTVWKNQIGRGLDRCWLLFLIGPPSIGKTQLMRSLGPHIYVRGFWALDPFLTSSTAQYVILDDVLLNKDLLLPSRAILLGMEGGCWLTDKYKKKVFVDTKGKPCCIISNDYKLVEEMRQLSAWAQQFKVCDVSENLFLENTEQDSE